jgi:hypothetical protein
MLVGELGYLKRETSANLERSTGEITPDPRLVTHDPRLYNTPITNPRTTYNTSHATIGLKSIMPNGGRRRRIGSISQLVTR